MSIVATAADPLDGAVEQHVRWGWRVESRSEHQVVMVKGHRPNHLLHFILTVFTLGLWSVVWLLLTAFGGEKRKTITA